MVSEKWFDETKASKIEEREREREREMQMESAVRANSGRCYKQFLEEIWIYPK